MPGIEGPVIVDCESRLEDRTRAILLARPDLHELREQYPCIGYTRADGRPQQHTFDFLATLTSGRRIAIAVKPKVLSDRRRFLADLALVAAAMPRRVADAVLLVTDADIDPTEAKNAAHYLHFAREVDGEADGWLTDRLPTLANPVWIVDLVEESGLGGRVFRAAFRAIYAGRLHADRRRPITPHTIIQSGAGR